MIPVPVDWFLIVRSCDEITLPRCSWAHFINLAQPLQLDRSLLEKSGTADGVNTEYGVSPYLHGDCWPIRSVEQASLIYIYAVCTVYWNVTGFDRNVRIFPFHFRLRTLHYTYNFLIDLSPAMRTEPVLRATVCKGRLLPPNWN